MSAPDRTPSPRRRYLTSGQVAEMFEVHPITVKEWADGGKLPGFKTPGGRWRFVREEIEALLPDGGRAA